MTRTFNPIPPLVLAASLVSLMPAPAPAEEAALSPGEIRQVLVGNTIHGIGEESGAFFAIYYLPDGTASGKSGSTETATHFWYEKGKWEIDPETGYCLTWNTWKRGVRRCMDMIPKEGGYEFRTKNGTVQSLVEVLPGNPDGL